MKSIKKHLSEKKTVQAYCGGYNVHDTIAMLAFTMLMFVFSAIGNM